MRSNKKLILFLLTVVYGFNFVDRQILGILAPYIAADLDLNDTQIGLLSGFYFALFYTIIGIPIGWLADRSNRVNIVSVSLAVWSACTALSGFAGGYLQLALARMGVGVGEAGGSPPSHSIISDLFPPHERARALGIYSLGIPIGIMSAYLVSAMLLGQASLNWRLVFIAIGIPGVVFALVIKLSIKEPVRGAADISTAVESKVGIVEAFNILFKIPSYWYMCLGISFASFVAYALTGFQVTYFVRRFPELPIQTILLSIGALYGVLYTAGTYFGGVLADRWGRRTPSGYALLPAIAVVVMLPALVMIYQADNFFLALTYFGILLFFSGFYLGPSFSIAQSLAPVRMRAMSTAIFFFVLNMIALGGGPTFAGKLSDHLATNHGAIVGLGKALTYTGGFLILSLIFFLLAARSLPADWQKSVKE